MPDREILDLTRLEEAFEDDTAGIAELLEMALETGRKHRRALEEGLAAGDAERVARAAHGIKGSAGNIGANVVYRLATELDARARTGNLDGARERIDRIDAEYERVAQEVRAYRESLA
ncbi:MAG TPA: Hpt domain-containing protein [Candidatus Elarobacter sp.]|nr:Hpt domain-containing protein [Candidatus Elarobacter sp.]